MSYRYVQLTLTLDDYDGQFNTGNVDVKEALYELSGTVLTDSNGNTIDIAGYEVDFSTMETL